MSGVPGDVRCSTSRAQRVPGTDRRDAATRVARRPEEMARLRSARARRATKSASARSYSASGSTQLVRVFASRAALRMYSVSRASRRFTPRAVGQVVGCGGRRAARARARRASDRAGIRCSCPARFGPAPRDDAWRSIGASDEPRAPIRAAPRVSAASRARTSALRLVSCVFVVDESDRPSLGAPRVRADGNARRRRRAVGRARRRLHCVTRAARRHRARCPRRLSRSPAR